MRFLILLWASSFAFAGSFHNLQQKNPRVMKAYKKHLLQVERLFRDAGVTYPPDDLFFRAFKRDKKLEIWAKGEKQKTYKLIKTYDVCATSGQLGPKRRAQDGQIPEGIYSITGFNPNSQYHLSLRVSYPNKEDKKRGAGNLGGDIFIHGDCVTIGCLPLTDDKIEEVYVMAVDTYDVNLTPFPVHIFPTKLDNETFKNLQESYPKELTDFWGELKKAYDSFELTHIPKTE